MRIFIVDGGLFHIKSLLGGELEEILSPPFPRNQVIRDQPEENIACLLAASVVYQLIHCRNPDHAARSTTRESKRYSFRPYAAGG